jgi:hypothetical protein
LVAAVSERARDEHAGVSERAKAKLSHGHKSTFGGVPLQWQSQQAAKTSLSSRSP